VSLIIDDAATRKRERATSVDPAPAERNDDDEPMVGGSTLCETITSIEYSSDFTRCYSKKTKTSQKRLLRKRKSLEPSLTK
jgi:hypothetical protein